MSRGKKMNNLTEKELIEFLSIMDKLQIENSPILTREEKEFMKMCIDEIKKMAKRNI